MATGRTDGEILKDLMDAVIEHEANRDAEWEFQEEHGSDGNFWNADDICEHDQILADIQSTHDRIKALIVEATGDKDFVF